MYLELCFVSANKTLQKYLVPVKLLDFPNLNKNAEFLGLKFNIDSADYKLCNSPFYSCVLGCQAFEQE